MAFIQGEDLEYIQERFAAELKSEVHLTLFTRGSYFKVEGIAEEAEEIQEDNEFGEAFAGESNRATAKLLEELAAISPEKIKINRFDLESPEGQKMGQAAGVDPEMLPAILFKSENLKGSSRYLGLPSGYEFGSLVENILDFSSGESALKPKTLESLADLTTSVHILVFVTPT